MRLLPRLRRGSTGYTLVELAISACLLTSLLLVAGIATDRAMDLFRQRRAADVVSTTASRLLQRAAVELAFARQSSLLPAPPQPEGLASLSFQRSLGVVGGAVVWGPVITLAWEQEPGELDNGLDDDGDGLIDEGQLVWTENAGLPAERRVIWGHGLCELLPGESADNADEDGDGLVDERGLCFAITTDLLTIRLGLQGLGPDRNIITRVVETSVLLRN